MKSVWRWVLQLLWWPFKYLLEDFKKAEGIRDLEVYRRVEYVDDDKDSTDWSKQFYK